jgi:hypothetical protein
MSDSKKINNSTQLSKNAETKLQYIFKLIDEISNDTTYIDRIKKYCEKIQNNKEYNNKTKYIKSKLYKFRKYPELEVLINELSVEEITIDQVSNDVEFEYIINFDNNVFIKHRGINSCAGLYSSLNFTSDKNYGWIRLFGNNNGKLETIEDTKLDLIYKVLNLKDVDKKVLSEFLSILIKKMKYWD